jgi:hypothetical protein
MPPYLRFSKNFSSTSIKIFWSYTPFCYILLRHSLGISARSDNLLLEFLESFVSSRVHSDLLQGLVLRPWLFCVFINYLRNAINESRYLIFALDIDTFRAVKFLMFYLAEISRWSHMSWWPANLNKFDIINSAQISLQDKYILYL